eukprot:scaffold142583_cov29-Tisochrysis_lutea.AAC.2
MPRLRVPCSVRMPFASGLLKIAMERAQLAEVTEHEWGGLGGAGQRVAARRTGEASCTARRPERDELSPSAGFGMNSGAAPGAGGAFGLSSDAMRGVFVMTSPEAAGVLGMGTLVTPRKGNSAGNWPTVRSLKMKA